MIKRKKITEEKEFSIDPLCSYIDNAIKYLQDMKADGWTEIDISCEKDWEGDISEKLVFVRVRPETDKEYHKRCKMVLKERERDKKLKAARTEAEIKLYQQLKQKYEKAKV
jgi:hypothetical protein